MKPPSHRAATSKVALALLPDFELPFKTDQFDDERIPVFLRAVFCGMSITDAQLISGLSPYDYGQWIQKGGSSRSSKPSPTPEEPYITFVELLEKCLLATKTVAVANLVRAIWEGDTDVSKWFLQRRFPAEYGEKATLPSELTSEPRAQVIVMLPDNGKRDTVEGDSVTIQPGDIHTLE